MTGKHQHTSGKRKLLTAALLLALCALCVGGSLAYFTTQTAAHNVITTGGVAVSLQEQGSDGRLMPYSQAEVVGIMPGAGIAKRPVAHAAEASADAWIRMRVTPEISLAGGGAGDAAAVGFDCNTQAWTDGGDGWWYYRQALRAGQTTKPLFKNVTFASWLPNGYQYAKARLTVEMQAVQVANNGASALDASGWPAETPSGRAGSAAGSAVLSQGAEGAGA